MANITELVQLPDGGVTVEYDNGVTKRGSPVFVNKVDGSLFAPDETASVKPAITRTKASSLISNQGITFSDPYNRVIGDYQIVTGSGAMDSSVIRSGSKTLRVDISTTADVNILHTVEAVLEPKKRVGVWVYVPDYTKLTSFVLKVSLGDSSFTNGAFQSYNFSDLDKQYNGWHFVSFAGADWTGVYGTPDWTTSDVSTIRLSISAASATSIYIDKYLVGWKALPKVMIIADDGYRSWFDIGLPILDAYGIKSAMGIIYTQVDTNSTWVTTDRLTSAYLNGHDLCPHGANMLSALGSDSARESDVIMNKNFLVNKGFVRGSDFYVWPNGVYQISAGDQSLLNILKRNGFKAARGTTVPRTSKHAAGLGDNKWLLPVIGADSSTSYATLKSRIDAALDTGDLITLMFHDIAKSGATGIQVNASVLDNVAQYLSELVSQGKVINVTPSDITSGL